MTVMDLADWYTEQSERFMDWWYECGLSDPPPPDDLYMHDSIPF